VLPSQFHGTGFLEGVGHPDTEMQLPLGIHCW